MENGQERIQLADVLEFLRWVVRTMEAEVVEPVKRATVSPLAVEQETTVKS